MSDPVYIPIFRLIAKPVRMNFKAELKIKKNKEAF